MAAPLKIIFAGLSCLAMIATAPAANLVIKGGDAFPELTQKWIEAFTNCHPAIHLSASASSTESGFASLQALATPLCAASRPIQSSEIAACRNAFGRRPNEYKVAIDVLAIHVNEANPVKELTLAQIKDVFSGKIKNWKEIGGGDAPITLYGRRFSSSEYQFFRAQVLRHGDFASSAQAMPSSKALAQAIARDKAGIGYGGIMEGKGMRAVAVKSSATSPAANPDEKEIVNGNYPLWRYLYLYANPDLDQDDTAVFVDWVRAQGQEQVQAAGKIPLPKNLRR